jgi:hypothetical protein
MKHRSILEAALAIVSICFCPTDCVLAQTAAPPAPGADYKINNFTSPATGQTLYFLRCDNGTTQCSYDWSRLCENGQALNADPLKGFGGKEASFIRDKDGTPLRMFICPNPG